MFLIKDINFWYHNLPFFISDDISGNQYGGFGDSDNSGDEGTNGIDGELPWLLYNNNIPQPLLPTPLPMHTLIPAFKLLCLQIKINVSVQFPSQ